MKIIIGFIVFAAIALFVLFKGGDKVDMSGEKHDTGSSHTVAPTAAPAAAASAAEVPASAASAQK